MAAAVVYEAGDVVTQGEDRGIVKQLTTREGSEVMRDGRRFLKVQIIEGPREGQLVWPDGWTIGYGPHRCRCLQCYRYYQSPEATGERAELCPKHLREATREAGLQAGNPSIGSRFASVRWRTEQRAQNRRRRTG